MFVKGRQFQLDCLYLCFSCFADSRKQIFMSSNNWGQYPRKIDRCLCNLPSTRLPMSKRFEQGRPCWNFYRYSQTASRSLLQRLLVSGEKCKKIWKCHQWHMEWHSSRIDWRNCEFFGFSTFANFEANRGCSLHSAIPILCSWSVCCESCWRNTDTTLWSFLTEALACLANILLYFRVLPVRYTFRVRTFAKVPVEVIFRSKLWSEKFQTVDDEKVPNSYYGLGGGWFYWKLRIPKSLFPAFYTTKRR